MATVCELFGLKTTRTVFSSLASKLVATISLGLASKPVISFLVEPQNQGGGGFPSLGLKTGISGLVIWASKSPRWFLGLGIKTKQASVCWLRHKTDGGRSSGFHFSFLWTVLLFVRSSVLSNAHHLVIFPE
jgi:hypothetical protein